MSSHDILDGGMILVKEIRSESTQESMNRNGGWDSRVVGGCELLHRCISRDGSSSTMSRMSNIGDKFQITFPSQSLGSIDHAVMAETPAIQFLVGLSSRVASDNIL